MKKIMTFFSLILLVTQLAFAGDLITKDMSKLPAAAREVLTKHFPNAKVSHIKIDKDALKSPSYDVMLDNGTKVEFNGKGEWTEVDCQKSAVPASVVPAAISKYITDNFKGEKIVKIEKDRKGNEIKLSNGTELKFDSMGKFIKLDH